MAKTISTSIDNTIKKTIMSTVYSEQHEKNRRAKSIVVTGIPGAPNVNDNDAISHLCNAELGINPSIKACRRIGKPVVGKIQPILVTVNSADEAQLLISNAKKLRHSSSVEVRDSVFINPSLTRAESQAAYEERCRRRAAAAARQQRDQTIHNNNAPMNSSNSTTVRTLYRSYRPPVVDPPSNVTDVDHSVLPISTVSSGLDPDAVSYQPSTSL